MEQNSTARVRLPERAQVEMRMYSLEQLLPEDHRARLVWKFVQSLDLTPLYKQIKVSHGQAGQSAIAPEILIALWLLATLDGIGSARELDRRCESDIPYLWIRGSVGVNYHTLSDFRVQNGEFLERLLVNTVAALIDRGLVPLETITQDGMRVRASAGRGSFRRKLRLEQLQRQAQDHVDRLKRENEDEPQRQAGEARRRAAQERAARERQERIAEALKQHEKLSQERSMYEKYSKNHEETRISTTDPDARKMKMGNGGYDPAYNVQFSCDADARMIVGMDVTNARTDGGQLAPMHKKICSDYDKTPKRVLVDSAYATKEGVTAIESAGTQVISTVPRSEQLKRHGKDPHERQKGDSDEYANFRMRMAKEENQELYKLRPSVAEFANADCRNRNLRQFAVRGLAKVKAVALWYAVAFNFMRMLNLNALGA